MRALNRILAAWGALIEPAVAVSRADLDAAKADWVSLLARQGDGHEVSFVALSRAGDGLVLKVAFGNPACSKPEFWAPLTSTTSGTEATLGWIKFKRGMAFNSTVLFEAIEVRAACSAALPPEPSLRASIALLQGGL